MSVAFIDWLYTEDSNGNKQGALIIYPRMLNKWNVASFIASQLENYKIVIVTDHKEEFMATPQRQSHDWTNLELVPFPLISYSDPDDINQSLKNTEVDIIIIDDVKMLSIITPLLDFTKTNEVRIGDSFTNINPKILILTTWGDSLSPLNIVTNALPGVRLLAIDFIPDACDIDWKLVRVEMPIRQYQYYDQIRKKEMLQSEVSSTIMNDDIKYPFTRMLTLYTYPDSMVENILENKGVLTHDWLNSTYIDRLCHDGPKLQSILDGIASNWPAKQIIMTRFNHRYGTSLIAAFLQLMISNKQNPYELDEIFVTTCSNEYKTNINTFHRFNRSTSGILITNIVPLIPLMNVSIIHLTDSYAFYNIVMLLNQVHKRSLNKLTNSNIIIYSYVATHPYEKSADEVLYETLQENVIKANEIYLGLISAADKIVFNPNMGLMIN